MGTGEQGIGAGYRESSGEDGRPDPAQLAHLLADVDNDSTIVARFVSDFLNLLDLRVTTVGSLVRSGEVEEARVALRSLETSSVMVGARRLGEVCRELFNRIGSEPLAALQHRLDELAIAAGETRASLSASLDPTGP